MLVPFMRPDARGGVVPAFVGSAAPILAVHFENADSAPVLLVDVAVRPELSYLPRLIENSNRFTVNTLWRLAICRPGATWLGLEATFTEPLPFAMRFVFTIEQHRAVIERAMQTRSVGLCLQPLEMRNWQIKGRYLTIPVSNWIDKLDAILAMAPETGGAVVIDENGVRDLSEVGRPVETVQ